MDDPTPDVWEEIIGMMIRRRELGLLRYGTPLRPGNGRDALRDLEEEMLDGLAYCRQARLEREALEAQNAALRKQVEGLAARVAAQSDLLSRRAEKVPHDA